MDYIEFMKVLVKNLIEAGLANQKKIKGCTQEEIKRLENYYGFILPESYKAFLIVMGHNCGEMYSGTDVLYNELFKILNGEDPVFCAREYMKELGIDPPQKNIFVYSMHQGYEFDFFFIENNDDPPVYSFIGEENAKIRGGNITFSNYIKFRAEQTIKFHQEHKKI